MENFILLNILIIDIIVLYSIIIELINGSKGNTESLTEIRIIQGVYKSFYKNKKEKELKGKKLSLLAEETIKYLNILDLESESGKGVRDEWIENISKFII